MTNNITSEEGLEYSRALEGANIVNSWLIEGGLPFYCIQEQSKEKSFIQEFCNLDKHENSRGPGKQDGYSSMCSPENQTFLSLSYSQLCCISAIRKPLNICDLLAYLRI